MLFCAGRCLASSAREDRVFSAASDAFRDALWNRAESEFADFVANYPQSDRVAGALLMEAQAAFKQGKFDQAAALLNSRQATAGPLADDYLYWIGQSQFQASQYAAAAGTFDQLVRNYLVSPWRLEAALDEALAKSKMGAWPEVVKTLEPKDGVFQQAFETNAGSDLVVRGQLLLAEAKYRQNDFTGAQTILQLLPKENLRPEFDWQRAYWQCRATLGAGDTNAALAGATNLIHLAAATGRDDFRGESVFQLAGTLEQLGQLTDAMAVYRQNLTNAPADMQRRAVLKIAELAIRLKQYSFAIQSLEDFLSQFPAAPAADVALLTAGELHLRNYVAQPLVTNEYAAAEARFDQFIGTYTNSPLIGKAYLDRGWCFWITNRVPESLEDFKTAVRLLPPSEDLLVAQFKLGDAFFSQTNFADARNNYRAVTENFPNFPSVGERVYAQALYQLLRSCLKLQDLSGATNALGQILKVYPSSNLADNSVLLVGEGLADLGQPVRARELFQKFEEQFPNSAQQPEVELAVARTYEQEQRWPDAIAVYDSWVERFQSNTQLPRVDYARAWANFQAGRETNAFQLYTNFITQFPGSDLAPIAQWWLGDHFYRLGDFPNAEKNYEWVFQNWPASDVADPARMMAGRAAMARNAPDDAIRYFSDLTVKTNCAPGLDAQALFAIGGAWMRMESPDTNDASGNFKEALNFFQLLCQSHPEAEEAWLVALARGEMGDCYFQLAVQEPSHYDDAITNYQQVINSPDADIAARSQAKVGIGLVFQKRAESAPAGDEQTTLYKNALDSYLDVLYQKNLRDGEVVDPFWTKKAGLQAAAVLETLGQWQQAKNVYKEVETLFPAMQDFLEKKIIKLPLGKN